MATNWVKDTPSESHEEQVIKNLLKKVYAEDKQHWHNVVEGLARRFPKEDDDDGRAPALQDDGAGDAAGSGD